MAKKMRCNRDCFNCKFDDCIAGIKLYSEKSLYKNRDPESRERQRAVQKKRRDEAKANGLCVVCKKKKATHGTKCYECYLRQKRHDRAKYEGRRQEWIDNGLCYFCGELRMEGQKVCEKHYKILFDSVKKTNEHPTEKMIEQRRKFKSWVWNK